MIQMGQTTLSRKEKYVLKALGVVFNEELFSTDICYNHDVMLVLQNNPIIDMVVQTLPLETPLLLDGMQTYNEHALYQQHEDMLNKLNNVRVINKQVIAVMKDVLHETTPAKVYGDVANRIARLEAKLGLTRSTIAFSYLADPNLIRRNYTMSTNEVDYPKYYTDIEELQNLYNQYDLYN